MKEKILVAEDDLDDQLLLEAAFKDINVKCELVFVNDGIETLEYLQNADCLPRLILLDLNMPRKDGKDTLCEIKSHEDWKKIPTLMFTTSDSTQDINFCYACGVNAYLTKPVGYDTLLKIVETINSFWLQSATLA